MSGGGRRRFFVPEVVQTSAMDCGPAALAAILAGFGVSASYGRLREACHTDVDGTSIDTLEDIAVLLGLDAAQVMAPTDHVTLPEAGNLPAIVVTRMANGFTHFVVAWRRVGRYVQLMDPGIGRRWVRADRFERDLYTHRYAVPAEAWHAWARSDELLAPLRRALRIAGVSEADAEARIASAAAAPDWIQLATLDAAARMAIEIAKAHRSAEADALVSRLTANPASIPDRYWFARPTEDAEVEMRGSVLVRVAGAADDPPAADSLPGDVAAVRGGPRSRPNRDVLARLWSDGLLAPILLVAGLVVAGSGTIAEAILFRDVLDDPAAGVPARLVALAGVLLVVEVVTAAAGLALGRRGELALRRSLFSALPRLPDAYLRSRPHSDMAERAHRIHQFRLLPEVGATVIRTATQLACVVIGLVVLVPSRAPLVVAAGAGALAIPLAAVPSIGERDLRLRTHSGALARFFLDALLGLVPLRSHAAEATLRGEHSILVDEWSDAGRGLFRIAVGADAVQSLIGVGLAVALVATLPDAQRAPGTMLLVAYWAVTVPVMGQTLTLALRQYPLIRNSTRRFLEPLGAREDDASDTAVVIEPDVPALGVHLMGVSVINAGHMVLEGIDFVIRPGEHVAVVGHSGAGKSTLAGLLVGWQRAATGVVLVGDRAPEGAHLASVRSTLAWVAPEVQLWNSTVVDNVRYGDITADIADVERMLDGAELLDVLERFDAGADAIIGEGGGLLSGGEGTRVRLARAMLRSGARLVVLDEPFRGLDRAARTRLLGRVRDHWSTATLLCVTHDVADTVGFPRVLVLEGGRVVEDGDPATLATETESRYRGLLDAERTSAELFGGWRHWEIADGTVR